ncbi:MAG TPA: hypothetical protein VHW64_07700 [Nocardioides sp.]|uniref:hypothetical protein n=1 Tax=Nocardioides sp. TaxID=35761 RepID=UPI002E33B6AD|nr:hypothetical protein [Nocardioides sp.]HEX3930571.1 hypothetical protein [Nocardioides sp.]
MTFTSAGHVWARRSKNHAKVHRIYGGHGSFGKPVFQEIRGDHLYVITNNTNSIVRMDLDGAHQEVIGRLPRGWHTFDISPSGKKLIYDAYGKNVNLKAPRIESLRTGRKGKPLSLSNVDGFDWNPNGKKIEYFLQGPARYGVGLMNGNGTHAHLVVRGAQLGTSPTLPQVVGLEWALGGRRLLAAVEDEQHDGLYLGWINPFAAHPHVTSVPGQVLHFRGAPLYDMDWARVGH